VSMVRGMPRIYHTGDGGYGQSAVGCWLLVLVVSRLTTYDSLSPTCGTLGIYSARR
jgi:hypothetical protein